MILGITGTDGAGKGEKWDGTHFARGCHMFLEFTKRNIDNLYSVCNTPVPHEFQYSNLNLSI